MSFSIAVKEQIARIIAEFFTTDQIVNMFADAKIPADQSLFAKWRITLDAFGKMSDPEASIPDILVAFCHPLNFQDPQVRHDFIKKLNAILAYENLALKPYDRATRMTFTDGSSFSATARYKTPIDYIIEAVNFFKNEYNKVRISGLSYEYLLGENIHSDQVENGREGYDERLKAVEELKKVGFITEYAIDTKVDDGDDICWDFAVCKIDESKLTQKGEPQATDAGAQALIQKIEITSMPELVVRNAEESTLAKGKKRICLPKFKPTDWAKITIRFLDGRNVLINADKKEQVVADYEALGFADERRDKPNMAWAFFLGLAQNNRETKPLSTPIPDNIKQQKRYLSDRLKTIFKNDTDPFYDPSETRTYKIKINLIPPQTEEKPDNLGIQEYLKETMTEKYEEPYDEHDR